MADDKKDAEDDPNKEFDLDTGEKSAEENSDDSPSKLKKLLLLGSIGVLILGIAVAAYMFLFASSASDEAPTAIAESPVVAEELKKKALYSPIENDFIATLQDEKGEEHHMVIAVTLMVREDDALKALNKNKPLLTNQLLELFESQNYREMKTIENKEALRTKALAVVQEAMKAQEPPVKIESVLFTKFMMD